MFREAFHIWNTLNSFREFFSTGSESGFHIQIETLKHSSILSIVTLPWRNPGSCSCSSINHPSWEDGDLNSDWSILPILDSDGLWQWQCCGIESFYRWECHHFISTVAKEHLIPDQWEARVVSSQPIRGRQWALSGSGGLNTSSSWLRQNRNKSRHSFFPQSLLWDTPANEVWYDTLWYVSDIIRCYTWYTMCAVKLRINNSVFVIQGLCIILMLWLLSLSEQFHYSSILYERDSYHVSIHRAFMNIAHGLSPFVPGNWPVSHCPVSGNTKPFVG